MICQWLKSIWLYYSVSNLEDDSRTYVDTFHPLLFILCLFPMCSLALWDDVAIYRRETKEHDIYWCGDTDRSDLHPDTRPTTRKERKEESQLNHNHKIYKEVDHKDLKMVYRCDIDEFEIKNPKIFMISIIMGITFTVMYVFYPTLWLNREINHKLPFLLTFRG